MNKETDDFEAPPADDKSVRHGRAHPEVAASAPESKRPVPGSDPAPAQAKRKNKADASARKRRKRFVL
jgi:hypothetical protein